VNAVAKSRATAAQVESADEDALPVDLETIGNTVDAAFAVQLSKDERPLIERLTAEPQPPASRPALE
jgi:hypothetical protein